MNVTRAWFWGIAIIGSASDTDVPVPDDVVAFGRHSLSLCVAHALDTEADDDDSPLASVTVTVVPRLAAVPNARRSLGLEKVSLLGTGISVGDADESKVLAAAPGEYLVRVSVPETADDAHLTHVLIEFARGGAQRPTPGR